MTAIEPSEITSNEPELLDTDETKKKSSKPKKPRKQTEAEVAPEFPMKLMGYLTVVGIGSFILSTYSVLGVSLDFLRILTGALLTYGAVVVALYIQRYPNAPHNQPKPGLVKRLKSVSGHVEEEETEQGAVKRILTSVGRWIRRSSILTRCWIIAGAGFLFTIYSLLTSLYPVGVYFGLL